MVEFAGPVTMMVKRIPDVNAAIAKNGLPLTQRRAWAASRCRHRLKTRRSRAHHCGAGLLHLAMCSCDRSRGLKNCRCISAELRLVMKARNFGGLEEFKRNWWATRIVGTGYSGSRESGRSEGGNRQFWITWAAIGAAALAWWGFTPASISRRATSGEAIGAGSRAGRTDNDNLRNVFSSNGP